MHVDLDGLSPHEKLTVRVVIDDAAVERTVEGVEGALSDLVVSVPLKRFRPWSPEHPNLYTARVDLVSAENRVLQSRFERFGVRKLEVRGKAFYLNDRPFYIRGCGHHNVYPLEGFAPANRELHRRHLALQRAAGFNFSRTHTRCPPPEHFDAADELGILIEAELPYYNDQPTQAFAFDPKRDVTELWRNFRRHPSFAVYSMGNEGTFSPEGDMRLHRYVKAMDPDRLKINQDGGEPSINPPEASDFLGGPIDVWTRGSFDPDRPFVAHEYLNLAVKFDPRREDRYTGVMPSPITRADRRALLAEFGLDEPWGDRLQDAQHALQRHYLKAGLESARLDPHCDGFCFWALTDTGAPQGKTVASVGLFDAFMGVKPNGFTPREMARFNSADCVLADLRPASRILAEGDRFEADVWFAHYSEARTSSAPTRWWLRTTDRVLVEGTLPSSPGDVSAVHLIGNVSFAVPAVGAPCKAEFAVKVGRAENHWDVWLFPRRETRALPDVAVADALSPPLSRLYGDLLGEGGAARAKLVVAPLGSALCADALARGQRVLAIDKTTGVPNIRLGWWWLGPQVGSALVDSPVFGALPHEGHLSPLLFRVVKLGLPLPVEGLLPQDVFMVDEGGKDFRLHLAQATCGKGSVLVCHGLDVLSGTPEGTALLDGLVDYALSDAFSPASEIELPRLGGSLRELNGWSRTVRRAEFLTSDLPSGAGAFEYVQGVEDRNEMSWLTAEVPLEIKDAPTCTFAFWGGMRYWARPEMPVSIFVDGVKAIDIPALVWADAVWRTGDCVLKYTKGMEGDRTGDYGLFELTVPTSLLAPGRPVELKAKAVLNGSGRAFGIIVPE
ncbi:MAG: glycoside hydrolase family 2 TIM barrel-domain containing protein [Kiritimatiellia bacterium]